MKPLLVLLLLSSLAFAAKKNAPTVNGAPIPDKMLAAKTVFLLVSTDKQEYNYKNAYQYLAEWDRWKIVTDSKDADIVIKITNRDSGSVGVGSASAVGGNGYAGATGTVLGIPLHHFYLSVIDRESDQVLWGTDTDERLMQSQNTKRMLKKLQERIAETEKRKEKK